MGSDHLDYQFDFDNILDVILFYANEILPCFNDLFVYTESTKSLSQVNNVHHNFFVSCLSCLKEKSLPEKDWTRFESKPASRRVN